MLDYSHISWLRICWMIIKHKLKPEPLPEFLKEDYRVFQMRGRPRKNI